MLLRYIFWNVLLFLLKCTVHIFGWCSHVPLVGLSVRLCVPLPSYLSAPWEKNNKVGNKYWTLSGEQECVFTLWSCNTENFTSAGDAMKPYKDLLLQMLTCFCLLKHTVTITRTKLMPAKPIKIVKLFSQMFATSGHHSSAF